MKGLSLLRGCCWIENAISGILGPSYQPASSRLVSLCEANRLVVVLVEGTEVDLDGGDMNLLKIAKPAVKVSSDATVTEAIGAMKEGTVGAVVVVDGDEVKGMFTERDVMLRVVSPKKDPDQTPVADVMTSPVLTISKETAPDDALKTMSERHFRHLPVVDTDGKVQAMISIRHLLYVKVENLTQELDSLEAYINADGIGG
jgi:CBS domain-containing protein